MLKPAASRLLGRRKKKKMARGRSRALEAIGRPGGEVLSVQMNVKKEERVLLIYRERNI